MSGPATNQLWKRLQSCIIWQEAQGLERQAHRLERSGERQEGKAIRDKVSAMLKESPFFQQYNASLVAHIARLDINRAGGRKRGPKPKLK